MLNLNRYIRYTLTRFRFGVSDIKVHRSRFKLYNVDELKCPLCLSAVENEVHFVLRCPAFEDLRHEFIESKYFNNPCEFRLALLLATQNERAFKNLALFLYKAEGKPCYREECKCTSRINIEERYYNILCIYFRSWLVHFLHSNISNLFTVCVCIVYCLIRFIVLTPLQMGLWPYWIKFPYSLSLSLSLSIPISMQILNLFGSRFMFYV